MGQVFAEHYAPRVMAALCCGRDICIGMEKGNKKTPHNSKSLRKPVKSAPGVVGQELRGPGDAAPRRALTQSQIHSAAPAGR